MEPVREFLQLLPDKVQQKIFRWIELLQTYGPELKRPYADKVSGPLYELRIRLSSENVRILYCFISQRRILLLHAFRKKTDQIEVRDIALAENRMSDYLSRFKD